MSIEATDRGERGLPRVGWLVVPLLGLFFLVYPVAIVLGSEPSPAKRAFALCGAALFATGFVWLMWRHEPLQLAQGTPAALLKYRAVIALLALLAGALSAALGPEWRMLFLYHINVAAGIMLPRRDAYVAIAGVAAITVMFGYPAGLAWLAAPAVALGLWATAFVGQAATVAELRAAREELARLAVAEERLRFARDLHDLLGHSLSLIALKSELAGRLIASAPERAAREIGEAEAVARRALREVREAVAGYRQPSLVEELHGAEELLRAAGIACTVEHGAGPLPKSLEAVLAWAIREGTTNVMRHSGASRCTIRLAREGETVRAEVCDDGGGRTAAQSGADGRAVGSGLSGLAERVAQIRGAEFAAGPLPAGGFRLRVSLPLAEGPAQEEVRQ